MVTVVIMKSLNQEVEIRARMTTKERVQRACEEIGDQITQISKFSDCKNFVSVYEKTLYSIVL